MNVIFRKRGSTTFAILPRETSSRTHVNEVTIMDHRGVLSIGDYITAMRSSSPARSSEYGKLSNIIRQQFPSVEVKPQLRRLEGVDA